MTKVDQHCGYTPANCPYGDACADCTPSPSKEDNMGDGIADGLDDVKDGSEIMFTPTVEAAAVNSLSQDIGQWATDKGFREEVEDADWLETQLPQVLNLPVNHITERLARIAQSHRRMFQMTKLMLIVTEVAEAAEGLRDDTNTDEEIADAIIRALELAELRRSPVGDEIIKKMRTNADRPHKHGRKL